MTEGKEMHDLAAVTGEAVTAVGQSVHVLGTAVKQVGERISDLGSALSRWAKKDFDVVLFLSPGKEHDVEA